MNKRTILLSIFAVVISSIANAKQVVVAKGNVVRAGQIYQPAWVRNEQAINQVLTHTRKCTEHIMIRYQKMTDGDVLNACKILLNTQARFHQLFNTKGRPVANDNNRVLRLNIYQNRANYVQFVTQHFDVPSSNGGMYLEGLPQLANNQAEYVAYLRNGKIWNLNHEFVHYLDGRFNTYGDYCASPHDDHNGPEYCPKPAPKPPYLIWWKEGIAEYVAHMNNNPKAIKLAKTHQYKLSELFYTSSKNWSTDRVYRWGYLASRYMMEKQRNELEKLLFFTRTGDYLRVQALMLDWGTKFDKDFDHWLNAL